MPDCGTDPGRRNTDRKQVSNRGAHLHQTLRVEREAAFEENDRHPEVDKRLEGVSERLGVDETEPERAAKNAKDEQGQDRRQLESLGNDLARDTECDGRDEGCQDGFHGASSVSISLQVQIIGVLVFLPLSRSRVVWAWASCSSYRRGRGRGG